MKVVKCKDLFLLFWKLNKFDGYLKKYETLKTSRLFKTIFLSFFILLIAFTLTELFMLKW